MENFVVPQNKIACVSHVKDLQTTENVNELYESLKGRVKRDWFVQHAYYCLPLVMGNQHGFILKSLYDFHVTWHGGDQPSDVVLVHEDEEFFQSNISKQNVSSHFGMGTFTVQAAFALRTPPGVNLMTINPPNLFKDGIYHMTGVIEMDNLRRDFTFNLRLTRENHTVYYKKGEILGCVIPYPRHFIDKYEMVDANTIIDEGLVDIERECAATHGIERMEKDKYKKHGNGRRYHNGEDVYGNKFKDHQTHLDS